MPRALAWVIDLFIRAAIFTALNWVFSSLAGLGNAGLHIGRASFILFWFVVEWFYPVLFEVFWSGATPGKKAMSLVVLRDDGAPVGWRESMIRNLLRSADFLPFLYGLGLLSMLISRDFKRLGDLAAGTVVAYRDRARRRQPVPQADPIVPHIQLSLAEQRALVDFAERTASLTPERAEELALLATPLIGNLAGPAAVARLVGMANYLIGRRK